MEPEQTSVPEETELGATGADLPLWRAREAIRNAELRLGVQASAAQALEGRATSMLGWSVAGVLAVGAAVVNGTHFWPASIAGACLAGAAALCLLGIVGRDFSGAAGYEPATLLSDRSASEYEALVSLAEGYQEAVLHNQASFVRVKARLSAAMILMAAGPLLGICVLAVLPQPRQACSISAGVVPAASAWAVCSSEPGWWERGSYERPPNGLRSCVSCQDNRPDSRSFPGVSRTPLTPPPSPPPPAASHAPANGGGTGNSSAPAAAPPRPG